MKSATETEFAPDGLAVAAAEVAFGHGQKPFPRHFLMNSGVANTETYSGSSSDPVKGKENNRVHKGSSNCWSPVSTHTSMESKIST